MVARLDGSGKVVGAEALSAAAGVTGEAFLASLGGGQAGWQAPAGRSTDWPSHRDLSELFGLA